MLHLIVIIGLLASVSSQPCGTEESHQELLMSLNKNLLRSLDSLEGLPNPSIYVALRLSNYHNHVKEQEYLNKLKTQLHNDIQSSLTNNQPVTGILALYALALKSSCFDLNTVTFTVYDHSENLLTHLKKQLELEKEHIAFTSRPLTNYYQYSLDVLAQCVSSIRVNTHVIDKLIIAADQDQFRHGETESIETYAMAAMALQCVKDSGSYAHNSAELDSTLSNINQKLLASRRTDGHMGNEFSTGLAVQSVSRSTLPAVTSRPLTSYYQYSLGVLALCVSSIRVNRHVIHKLIIAADQDQFRHGETESIDTYAMAGMALQCVKDSGSYVRNSAELDSTLSNIKQKLLASRRTDGHMGNEFSTGLAVQALLAMGSDIAECAASMVAMRTAARNNVYHNPMAISQTLPALQKKSYLTVKSKQCLNEDNSLVLEPTDPTVVVPSSTKVNVMVEVVMSSEAMVVYSVDVPKGSSLLDALNLLKTKNVGFMFELEPSLWGPFLSSVDGEQARQGDRRYWHLSSDGTALTEGVSDFKIETAQKIRIKNTSY